MKKQQATKTKVVRYTREQLDKLDDKSDYTKIDNLRDDDIDYSDTPETTDAFWADAKVCDPGTKKSSLINT